MFGGAIALLHLSNIWKSFAIPSRSVRPSRAPGIFLVTLLLLCAVILVFVLAQWADREVRADSTWIFLYLIFSLAWILAAQEMFAFVGISWRDDFLERRNGSAAIAFSGFTFGATFCTAGANVGNGPGWWVVLFCAALSTCALLVLWVILNWIGEIADAIAIERDLGAGIRAGGYLAAAGLILGISVSGDWKSLQDTILDFIKAAWPAALFLFFSALCERIVQSRKRSARVGGVRVSVAIALVMIAAAATYSWKVGIR